jgi:hypothetical protein
MKRGGGHPEQLLQGSSLQMDSSINMMKYGDWVDPTIGLIFLATAFEKADEAILPACFGGIEADLGWSPGSSQVFWLEV